MSELVYRKPCEHGFTHNHETSECWAHDERHKEQPDCRCPGGVEQVLDPDKLLNVKATETWSEWSDSFAALTVADVLAVLDGEDTDA